MMTQEQLATATGMYEQMNARQLAVGDDVFCMFGLLLAETKRLIGADTKSRVDRILVGFATPWRWFQDGRWIVMEPPHGLIAAESISYIENHDEAHTVEAVFRSTPRAGIYLRFQLREQR